MATRRQRVTQSHAAAFLSSLRDLRIELSDPVSYDEVFRLAEWHGLTMYDAAYLDLAIRKGLPLASLDAQLIRAAVASGISMFQV